MPNFDRTGPQGAAPMTGWGQGLCGRRRGQAGPAFGPGPGGRRRGRGPGFGRGFAGQGGAGMMPTAAPAAATDGEADPRERRAVLKAERNRLKSRLAEVEETLKAIGREAADDAEA